MIPESRLIRATIILTLVIIMGIVGYMTIENWSFLDSLYMTITTITTVGFREVKELSTSGKIFTIFLIIFGVGGAFYTLSELMSYVVEGQFRGTIWRRRMENKIKNMHDHFVICGYGRVGREVAARFMQEGVKFVVIDHDEDAIKKAQEKECLYILGDTGNDSVLKEAGIEKAKGIVVATGDDAENILITLSARALRPDIFVVARSSNMETEPKLRKVGADRVISPHTIGGRRMAYLALRPASVELVDMLIGGMGEEDLLLEDIQVDKNSPLVNATAVQCNQYGESVRLLAIKKISGKIIAPPPSDAIIEVGDKLIVIGTRQHLKSLEEAVC
jgi:voltage-gated potassium channel